MRKMLKKGIERFIGGRGMNRRVLAILIIFIMFFSSYTGALANREDSLTIELKEKLIPLKTTMAGNGFEDLMPLKEILKDKKIIAMGEATHGTAEFFQMKHRMFEFLVKEMGYRVFGIEATFGSSKIINDYILYGEGSVEKSVKAMGFWVWDTKEVTDMIKWMREFNKSVEPDDKIRFYGFDMQLIDNSLNYLLDYLEKVEFDSIEEYRKKLKHFSRFNGMLGKGNIKALNKIMGGIHNQLRIKKDNYIENSSIEEYDLILHNLEIIYQYIDYMKDDSFNKRDHYMAENVNWILDYEDKHYGNHKIMLWAHNGHISNGFIDYINMGENLKGLHKEDYYSVGFEFYDGSFVSLPLWSYMNTFGILKGGMSSFHIDSTPEGSFAHEMMKTEIPISFLDFKSVEYNKEISRLLSNKVHVNRIGAVYTGKGQNIKPDHEVILKDTFDSIIFVKSTTAAIRSGQKTDLPNGNRIINLSYALVIILIILLPILFIREHKKKPMKLKEDEKFYILGKDKEDSIGKNKFKDLVIKINDYLNSLSTIKYSIFVMIFITILTCLSILSKSTTKYIMLYYSQGIFVILNLIVYSFIETIKIFVIFILPLKIIGSLYGARTSYLMDIFLAAIIGGFINTIGFLNSGVLLYSWNTLLCFIKAFIYCYSYSLFNSRYEKPMSKFYPILIAHNIIMILFTI